MLARAVVAPGGRLERRASATLARVSDRPPEDGGARVFQPAWDLMETSE